MGMGFDNKFILSIFLLQVRIQHFFTEGGHYAYASLSGGGGSSNDALNYLNSLYYPNLLLTYEWLNVKLLLKSQSDI